MTKAALILVAIATATAAFATAPAHAGGPRLQFGGPLGSFVATPFAKGSAHKTSHRNSSSHAQTSKRAAQRRAAARKTAARRAAAQKLAAQKAKQKIEVAKVETKTETKSEWKAPVRASAIAGTNTLNFRNNDAPAKIEPVVAKVEKTENSKLQKEPTEVAELSCKRYIPSAGMTVTVPCAH